MGGLDDDGDAAGAARHQIVFKPRGEWHTFWNPGDVPLRILEIITPSGLEDLRELGAGGRDLDPTKLPALAGRFGLRARLPAHHGNRRAAQG